MQYNGMDSFSVSLIEFWTPVYKEGKKERSEWRMSLGLVNCLVWWDQLDYVCNMQSRSGSTCTWKGDALGEERDGYQNRVVNISLWTIHRGTRPGNQPTKQLNIRMHLTTMMMNGKWRSLLLDELNILFDLNNFLSLVPVSHKISLFPCLITFIKMPPASLSLSLEIVS